jgi:hypothetical protein
MSKKALILIAVVVLALSAIGVMAQDGPGVINVTLPDGSIAPVFTDGRINGFDIGAPLVVYYKTEAGTIANPTFAGSNLPTFFDLTGDTAPFDPNFDASAANPPANVPLDGAANANPNDDANTIASLQLLAIDPATSNGNLVLEASVADLFNLVNTRQHSIDENGYTLNYSPQSNWFWVSAPADFEGKVYTFAWENTLFPAAQQDAQVSAQATAEPTSDATAQATAMPTVEATVQTTSP